MSNLSNLTQKLKQLARQANQAARHVLQRTQPRFVAFSLVVLVGIMVIAVIGRAATNAFAGNSAIKASPTPDESVTLVGELPKALSNGTVLGPVDTTQPLDVTFVLRLTNQQGLTDLLTRQNDPKSPDYHKYLTPDQFVAQFAPTQASVDAATTFLKNAGFQIKGVSSNRMLIQASGTVAKANQAFHTTISRYQLDKKEVFAPTQMPSLPHSLASIVVDIEGLSNVGKIKPLLSGVHTEGATTSAATADSPNVINPSPIGGYTPTNLRDAYQVTPLISNGGTGSGQHIAIFSLAPLLSADVSTFRANYGLPNSTITGHSVDGATVFGDGSGTVEADLDAQVISAMAPNATIDFYSGPNTFQGVLDTYNTIVNDGIADVISTSWGLCEPFAGSNFLFAEDSIFYQAAVQGQSIFAASGDAGSDDCDNFGSPAVDSPASDPLVVAVGGTSLTLSGGAYSSETTWNDGFESSGGGGLSQLWAQPSWQVGVGVNNPYATNQRRVPDVSAHADPNTGYAMYCTSAVDCARASDGQRYGWVYAGGTSAAAPLWAGILGDINTYTIAQSGWEWGWVNSELYLLNGYSLSDRSATYGMFNDVTVGTNDADYGGTPYAGYYPATTCYDQVTGIGTPNAWHIAQVLQGGTLTSTGPCAAASSPTGTNLITAGGFEGAAATTAWSQFSNRHPNAPNLIQNVDSRGGSYSAILCSLPIPCDDRISQTLTIPATVNVAQLQFWYATSANFTALGTSTPPCSGHLYVTLATPDGTVFSTVEAICSNETLGYVQLSADVKAALAAHLGQSVVLTFRGANNSIAYSNTSNSGIIWSVDDVSLTVS